MKFNFIRTQPGPFIYIPSRVAFVLFATDLMTHNIYYLAQDRKILLTPILKKIILCLFLASGLSFHSLYSSVR